MQLLEAVVLSVINTLIITSIFMIRIIPGRKVRIYGPVIYIFDKSGVLGEAPPNSIPLKDMEALRERILSEVKSTRSPRLKKTMIALFTAIISLCNL